MLARMVEALRASRDPALWPGEWPPIILSDIENGFCELAKYRATWEGKRQKHRSRPAA